MIDSSTVENVKDGINLVQTAVYAVSALIIFIIGRFSKKAKK